MTLRVEVDVTEHGWRLSSPDLPGWQQHAVSPTHLGVLIREANRRVQHRLDYLKRLNQELPPTERADSCMSCGDVFVQARRSGAPALSCEDCRRKKPGDRPRRRLGHLRLV